MKKFLIFLLVAGLAAAAWFKWGNTASTHTKSGEGQRKILFYQSAMHPWIKSDKPGKCTICGMELSPVYEGDKAIALDPSIVSLSSNSLNVIHVKTEAVKRGALKRTLRVAGLIEDNDTRHRFISAYVDGRIEKLFVNFIGAEVKGGEPLASLYSPTLAAAVREYLVLLRTKGDSREFDSLVKGAAYRLERLGITEQQVSSLSTSTNLSPNVDVVSPTSGTVIQRFVYEGQYVKEGEKLFELADFSTMWFRFDAYEQDLAWLRLGQSVEVKVASVPGKVFTGKINFIDPNIQDQSRTARVRVELENPLLEEGGRTRRELFYKTYAEGKVQMESPETLLVPRSALLSTGTKPSVYIQQEPGTYQRRSVTIGRIGDEFVEVLEGLQEAELIVTAGNLLIDSQAQINQSISPGPEMEPAQLPELSETQSATLDSFFKAAAQVSESLAADDLPAFNALVEGVNQAADNLHKAAAGHPIEGEAYLLTSFKTAANLAEARAQFLPFSKLVVPLAEKSRRSYNQFKGIKVFKCPMAPKPGQTSFWIQLQGPLRNPYYGSEMLDCGSEVKLP